MSSLLNIEMYDEMIIKSDIDDFRRIVRSGFGNRRKQFAKNLSNDFDIAKKYHRRTIRKVRYTKRYTCRKADHRAIYAICDIIFKIKNK